MWGWIKQLDRLLRGEATSLPELQRGQFDIPVVGIQMGWALRPFIGSPFAESRFFREGAFSNAYVVVGNLIWDVLTRMFR